MSEELEEGLEESAPEEPAGDPKIQQAMRLMEDAMKSLGPEERKVLRELMAEVDQAMAAPGAVADKQLELCYTIKFSQDRLPNGRLRSAAEAYIAAVEG